MLLRNCDDMYVSIIFWGMGAYYVVHTFIGRIFFYVLSVYLYFLCIYQTSGYKDESRQLLIW